MKKWIVVAVVGLLVLIVVALLVSNKDTGQSTPGAEPSSIPLAEHMSKYESEYLYFVFPDKFSMVDVPARDGRVYTNVEFYDSLGEISKMSLLFRESTQELNELADVKMRRANSYQYFEEVARIGDIRGLLFRTADRKERVAYLIKKGRLLVVTMITVGTYTDEAETEFQNMLKSVVWK